MAIIRWNPFNVQSFLDDDFDFPSLQGMHKLAQGLNIYETADSVVAEVALPGISEDKIDVTVDNSVVRVFGSEEENSETKEERRYFMSSRSNSFNYTFRLPEGMVEDIEPKAELHNGVLTLTFSKVKKIAPKKVKVITKGKENN